MRNTIAALVIRKKDFVCCARGAPANSGTNPAADTGATPLTIPEEPLKDLVGPLKRSLLII